MTRRNAFILSGLCMMFSIMSYQQHNKFIDLQTENQELRRDLEQLRIEQGKTFQGQA